MEKEIRIISVEKKKKNYVVSTNVDDYVMDEDTILKHMVFKDKVFTKKAFQKILDDCNHNQTFLKGLGYLRYGLRSEAEMRAYLKDNIGIDQAIEKLRSLGYINDEKMASYLLDYYVRQQKGPRFIENKMFEKKIPQGYIKRCLKQITEQQEYDLIAAIINKQIDKISHHPLHKQKTMLISKCIRDGFSPNIVYEVMQSIHLVDGSQAYLQKDYEKAKRFYQEKALNSRALGEKIVAKLMQKGYSYEQIRLVMSEDEDI